MPADFAISVQPLAGSKVSTIDRFSSYNCTQDLMSGLGSFSCSVAATPAQRKLLEPGGQRVTVTSYGAVQLIGIADERSEDTSTTATDLHFSGRCVGALLLDSCVPIDKLSIANLTLLQIAERITAPWQPDLISSVVTDAAGSRYIASGTGSSSKAITKTKEVKRLVDGVMTIFMEPYTIGGSRGAKAFGKKSPQYRGTGEVFKQTRLEPGAKVLETLRQLASQIGAHCWVGADGALIIARPTYEFDATAYGEGIVLNWDKGRAIGGNVRGATLETSIQDRYSEYLVYGKGKPRKTSMGRELAKHKWSCKDPSPAFWTRSSLPPYLGSNRLYKPSVLTVQNISSEKLIRRVARSAMEQAAIGGFSLEYELNGHHAPSGALWTVDTMVMVNDQRNNLNGNPYYITRVERRYDMQKGKTTLLKLIPPDIWLATDHDTTTDDVYIKAMMRRIWW